MRTISPKWLAAALLSLASSIASAGQFTLLIYESSEDLALRSQESRQSVDYWAQYKAFGAELAAAKIIRGGAPLDVPATAQSVGRSGAHIDAHSGLGLGGYFQIEVASIEEALQWARKAPAVRRGGLVEVRPVVAAPGM